ncbi:MAG: 16S rRNA (cytosine(1402)-N(4))-methyltransferase, partial [bacterium]|nr:16S rRNA (cytosine(1402)-N(4))-methyltransferase [bacterium]
MEHSPVLLKEAIDFLNLRGGKVVLDATADGGGHAMEICRRIGEDGLFIGIDEDSELLKAAETKLQNADCKSILILGNFRNLDKLLEKINFLDAVFFDLGMSSLQLHNSGRGFSFKKDEPLVMTFKSLPEAGDLTAAEILNKFPEEEIQRILKDYGEERYAWRIAKAIVRERKYRPFKTTFEL